MLEAYCDPEGKNKHGLLPFYSENDSFLSHEVVGQFVFCNPPWSLVVQYMEYLRMCNALSLTNTKAIIVLHEWPKFKSVTISLKLPEHIPIDTPAITKPSPLRKGHTLVKVPWSINYWVIDKDTHVKVSSTHVHRANSPIYITTSINQSDIVSHWLPSATALTIMDPNEPEPLLKLPVSVENDSLRYSTSGLIDSEATLNFVSQQIWIRNSLV